MTGDVDAAVFDEWDVAACPRCQQPLTAAEIAQIAAQAESTAIGTVSGTRVQDSWRLACGHLVESYIDRRTATGYSFLLRDAEPR